ncbi:hypothetical protein ACFLVC_04940 [Chloroflexota bacterium]
MRIVRIVVGIILVAGAVFLAVSGFQVLLTPKPGMAAFYRVLIAVSLWFITAILGLLGYHALKVLKRKK